MIGVEFLNNPLPVAGSGAFFVVGEEGGGLEAGPEGFAFGGEGVDLVEVGREGEVGGVGGGEPSGQGFGGALDEGDDGVAPEAAVGFGVIGVGVVAGDGEQHRGARRERGRFRGRRRVWY